MSIEPGNLVADSNFEQYMFNGEGVRGVGTSHIIFHEPSDLEELDQKYLDDKK